MGLFDRLFHKDTAESADNKKTKGNEMENKLNEALSTRFGKNLDTASKEEIFDVLMQMTKDEMEGRPEVPGDKKLYYISAEFLIGKLLSNNLINLGLYDQVADALKAHGKDITEIEEIEDEPSLGNGGLGRLAACFLDSIASLNLPGDGIGLNYHYGLFKQEFKDHLQHEVKNPWINKESWLEKREGVSFKVPFRKYTVNSVLYDIDVPGYETGTVNRLHLFDLDSVDDNMVGEDSIDFDKKDIERNLTLFLYPDDSDDAGRQLRIYQQYFMVSCGAQLILKEMKDKGFDLHDLDKHVAIQINDTHPSMVIPELIRLLQLEGFTMDEAIEVVSKTCAYTNHTILAEALEKWPMDYMEEVVPHLLPIIRELDNRVRHQFDDKSVYIIDDENRVHMAHMDIHYGHSVNGVAALHTEILKDSELNNFYKIYPEKFNNKTNGITFRRWLLHCNPLLTREIEKLIGDGFKKDAMELEKLGAFVDDKAVLNELETIKTANKVELADYMKNVQGIEIDPTSIFDVQVKRLHEYKRQQMNCLYAIYKYLEIKKGNKPARPITMIFGAKAAPAYIIAKDIIHLILCLQDLTANDPDVAPYFRVVMAENYNVTYAGKIIPAAEISEQISLASKEASGTSNMKFMLNGAITLGTMDGANVEIHDLVGKDNIYIFGKDADTVVDLYAKSGYVAADYYNNDPVIHELVDFIIGDEMMSIGNKENLERLHHELISKDWFMTLLDTKEYIETKEKVYADYEDRDAWNRKALVNISKAGFFSSDRTIDQYNKDIWKLK
jgi:starch phosphorylase